MKKIRQIFTGFLFIAVSLLISSCSIPAADTPSSSMENNINENLGEDGKMMYEKDFGYYEVTNGWIEHEGHSTSSKFFYVKSGTENENRPNNIAVSMGTYKYTASQHDEFRQSLMQQLSNQLSGNSSVQISADGSTTDQGYVMYRVTATEPYMVSVLYYIVGDYKYCLVQSSNFDNSTEIDEVAFNIANSFVWTD